MNIPEWPDFENLVYYDGPQLILARTTPGYYFLATAVPCGPNEYLMFGVDIHETFWESFMARQIDLRTAFTLGEHPRIIDMATTLEYSVIIQDKYLPSPGFWSDTLELPKCRIKMSAA